MSTANYMILEISLQLCYNTNKAKGGKIHEPFEGSKIGYRNESKDVADALHLAPPSVSNWESGKTNPSQDNLKALAELYHISIDYLLGRDRKPCITVHIVGPSADEINELMQKASTLPDLQYQMAESFLQFLIALHDGGRIRYAELAMLEDYIEFLASQH